MSTTIKYTLYHKISPLGLNYLGSTKNVDPIKYKGNGTYWKLHLKKHNFKRQDIKTIILFETFDKYEIRRMGLYYSQLFNVVESEEWANLIPESGDGVHGGRLSEEHKRKLSISSSNKKNSKETREKISKANKGRKLSEETKMKIAIAHTGKKLGPLSEEHKRRLSEARTGKTKPGVPVINKETGELYPSVRVAAQKLKKNESYLALLLRNKSDNSPLKYANENYVSVPKPSIVGRIVSEETKLKMKIRSGIARKVVDVETSVVYNCIVDAAKSIGIKSNTLSSQLKHNRKCRFKYL